jgi:hypothetical protein
VCAPTRCARRPRALTIQPPPPPRPPPSPFVSPTPNTTKNTQIAKNIVLAGVGQVTLAADGPASAHAGGNFLIPNAAVAAAAAPQQPAAADVAARTLQEMNPLVRVAALPGGAAAVDAAAAASNDDDTDDPIAQHDLVIWCGPATALLRAARADAACRRRGKLFMAAAVSGHAGYCFCDYGPAYTYRPKENEAGGGGAQPPATGKDAAAGNPQPVAAEQTVAFSTLADALAAPLGGLHANAHPLFPVLCATASVEKEGLSEQQQQQQELDDKAAPPPPPTAAAVERALREGALGGSPAGPDLLAAAVDLARAYVGQAERKSGGGEEDVVASVMREYAPAAAAVGAVAANAALRAVSRSGAPLRNAFFYSCADGRGLVEDQPALAEGGVVNGCGGGGGVGKRSGGQAGADQRAAEEVALSD